VCNVHRVGTRTCRRHRRSRAIQEDEFHHTAPCTGDHGIQYAAKPRLIGGLIKVADPEEGTTYEDCQAICKALGVELRPKAGFSAE
jgi:hypothetical protein